MWEQVCVTVDYEDEVEGPHKIDIVMIKTCNNMKDYINPTNV